MLLVGLSVAFADSRSDDGSASSVKVGCVLVADDTAEAIDLPFLGRLLMVCKKTLRSLGGTTNPTSTLSTRVTLASQLEVGAIAVGRVNVAVTK